MQPQRSPAVREALTVLEAVACGRIPVINEAHSRRVVAVAASEGLRHAQVARRLEELQRLYLTQDFPSNFSIKILYKNVLSMYFMQVFYQVVDLVFCHESSLITKLVTKNVRLYISTVLDFEST